MQHALAVGRLEAVKNDFRCVFSERMNGGVVDLLEFRKTQNFGVMSGSRYTALVR